MFPVTKTVKNLPVVRLVDTKLKRTIALAAVISWTASFLAGNYASAKGVALMSAI